MGALRNYLTLHRELLGSDLIIVGVIVYHLYQATVLLVDPSAHGALPMATLLTVFRLPQIAAGVLYLACILAAIGQWVAGVRPVARLWLLILQQVLLIITAGGSINAIVHSSFADGVLRSANFILAGECPRLFMPLFYTAAILARIRPRRS